MIKTGVDVLQERNFDVLQDKRVGLMTNPSAVDANLHSTYRLFANTDVNLTALFSPEHGFLAQAAEGASVASSTDARTGVPIYSLYGATRRPTQAMFADIDVIVCDVQDIGVRYYTYTWTVSHIIEAAGEYGVEVVILDRPNPLGDATRGAPLYRTWESFVGRYPVPIQHGMTLGEMAQMVNQRWSAYPNAKLTVIPCTGWQRDQQWAATGLQWVTPSPNMPHLLTAQHYPGSCLLEGTTLSEGRGTALPFEVVGAPYIDAETLADHINAQGWAGMVARPHAFQPAASKYAGEVCNGVQIHITDSAAYDPILTWLGIIREIRNIYHQDFAWLPPVQVDLQEIYHFDRLIGSSDVREMIDDGTTLDSLTHDWDAFCERFREQRQPYLIYE